MGFGRHGMGRVLVCGLFGLALGCGNAKNETVLRVDAEFDPATAANTFRPIHEANRAVAQTFTVENDGRLEEFWLLITDGISDDAGTIRVTIQPVDAGGVIDFDVADSIIDPILVNTSTLPDILLDEYTEFFIGDEPGRDVVVGERYALVVEFVSRATSTDVLPIAIVLGQTGNPFADGTAATGQLGVGFTNNTDDHFFRTFVLD